MGQTPACHIHTLACSPPPKLSQPALDALCRELLGAAEFMADEQILCVADALHDTLRHRKQLRRRVHRRVEERLCSGGQALAF